MTQQSSLKQLWGADLTAKTVYFFSDHEGANPFQACTSHSLPIRSLNEYRPGYLQGLTLDSNFLLTSIDLNRAVVFCGDLIDNGPYSIRLLQNFNNMMNRNQNLFCLLGNRDVNKLRYLDELKLDDASQNAAQSFVNTLNVTDVNTLNVTELNKVIAFGHQWDYFKFRFTTNSDPKNGSNGTLTPLNGTLTPLNGNVANIMNPDGTIKNIMNPDGTIKPDNVTAFNTFDTRLNIILKTSMGVIKGTAWLEAECTVLFPTIFPDNLNDSQKQKFLVIFMNVLMGMIKPVPNTLMFDYYGIMINYIQKSHLMYVFETSAGRVLASHHGVPSSGYMSYLPGYSAEYAKPMSTVLHGSPSPLHSFLHIINTNHSQMITKHSQMITKHNLDYINRLINISRNAQFKVGTTLIYSGEDCTFSGPQTARTQLGGDSPPEVAYHFDGNDDIKFQIFGHQPKGPWPSIEVSKREKNTTTHICMDISKFNLDINAAPDDALAVFVIPAQVPLPARAPAPYFVLAFNPSKRDRGKLAGSDGTVTDNKQIIGVFPLGDVQKGLTKTPDNDLEKYSLSVLNSTSKSTTTYTYSTKGFDFKMDQTGGAMKYSTASYGGSKDPYYQKYQKYKAKYLALKQ